MRQRGQHHQAIPAGKDAGPNLHYLRIRELTKGLEQEVTTRNEALTLANKQPQVEIIEREQVEAVLRESRQCLESGIRSEYCLDKTGTTVIPAKAGTQ